MNRRVAFCGLVALASPLAAVEWIEASFGNQPVAIGAGPRALGMGGAFSAVADDASASTWNPAGLTQCERPEVAASAGFYATRVRLDGREKDGDDLQPEHLSAMLPFYAMGCQQVIGVAWQRTFDFTSRTASTTRSVIDDGFGTIVSVDSDATAVREGAFSAIGLCYGIEPTPGLSLGVTVNTLADRWTQASRFEMTSHEETASVFDFSGFVLSETGVYDVDTSTRVLHGTSFVLGALWQALPTLTVAVVAKPSHSLDLESDSDLTAAVNDGFSTVTTSRSQTLRSRLHQPTKVTLGTAWRGNDLDTVTCDATWTRWRQYYLDQSGDRRSPVSYLLDPSDFDDLWTLRVGYEHIAILSGMVLVPRCGAVVEWLPAQTAAPDVAHPEDVSATSDLWLGLTAGASLCLRSVIWDAGVQVRHGDDVAAGQLGDPTSTADITVLTARLGVTLQF